MKKAMRKTRRRLRYDIAGPTRRARGSRHNPQARHTPHAPPTRGTGATRPEARSSPSPEAAARRRASRFAAAIPLGVLALLLTFAPPAAASPGITSSGEDAHRYAARHVDRGVQRYFVDLHYFIRHEEREGSPRRDPVDLMYGMADHYGNDDGRVTTGEKEAFANVLDHLLPALADFEYGGASGRVQMTDYEKMVSDLRLNQTFDTARTFTREYTAYYNEVELDEREEVRRYLRPAELEAMYQAFRDSYSDRLARRRDRPFPRYEPERREDPKELIEMVLDQVFRALLEELN